MAGSNWSSENYHCTKHSQRHAQHLRKMRAPNSSSKRQWSTLFFCLIWRIPAANGVQRALVSPYHLYSNGLAERFVHTFKNAFDSSASDPAVSVQQRIQNFLLSYRSTPHATTGTSPSKLFSQRELRTRLSLTKPDLSSHVATQQGKIKFYHDRHATSRELSVDDTVLT